MDAVKQTNRVILLDMDGVVADFISAAFKALGKDPKLLETCAPNDWWFKDVLGPVTKSDFWSAIDWHGEGFWSGLKRYEHAKFLHSYLAGLAPTYFLTAPSRNPVCLSGKAKWLQEHFPLNSYDYIMTGHKQLVAKRNYLLVDDNNDNVDQWVKAGGAAVLFPQRWNRLHAKAGVAVKHVVDEVNAWMASSEY